jgi:hypothetical protein
VEADDAKPAVILLDEKNAIVRESGTVHC